MNSSLSKAVREFQPEVGLVLGSGLGPLVDEVDAILSVPYEEIGGLPVSTAPGHAGRFVFGRLADRRVIVAQGRVHLYEGCSAEEYACGPYGVAVGRGDGLGEHVVEEFGACGPVFEGLAAGAEGGGGVCGRVAEVGVVH